MIQEIVGIPVYILWLVSPYLSPGGRLLKPTKTSADQVFTRFSLIIFLIFSLPRYRLFPSLLSRFFLCPVWLFRFAFVSLTFVRLFCPRAWQCFPLNSIRLHLLYVRLFRFFPILLRFILAPICLLVRFVLSMRPHCITLHCIQLDWIGLDWIGL